MINRLMNEGIWSVWTELDGKGDPRLNVHHIQPLYMPMSYLCLLYCLSKLLLPYFAFFFLFYLYIFFNFFSAIIYFIILIFTGLYLNPKETTSYTDQDV